MSPYLIRKLIVAFLLVFPGIALSQQLPFTVPDTAQAKFYDTMNEISAPAEGAVFYGQDAQYFNNPPAYSLSADGLTAEDEVTGLVWQRTIDRNGDGAITAADKLAWLDALAYPDELNAMQYGGYDDWRLPSIKELYSLILFNGTDPSGLQGNDVSGLTPFIDTNFFAFAYGDTSAGERIIDSQYWSSTEYVHVTMINDHTVFGVNFADGRIKGYGTVIGGRDKTSFVLCVRGNTGYGLNEFIDNGDGTITDRSTGLMWTQADSGEGMEWRDALAYAEGLELAGHSDWRLPNVKELQSILDYTRSPETTGSAALDPLFEPTAIQNERGEVDYPYYWSGTTHATHNGMGRSASYVSIGRAMGYMNGQWLDVHGAGAQRSDPKAGDLAEYPTGFGPQGDAIRILNYAICVRNVEAAPVEGWALYE